MGKRLERANSAKNSWWSILPAAPGYFAVTLHDPDDGTPAIEVLGFTSRDEAGHFIATWYAEMAAKRQAAEMLALLAAPPRGATS